MYAPVRHHEFVNFDDPQYVTENRHVVRGLNGPGLVLGPDHGICEQLASADLALAHARRRSCSASTPAGTTSSSLALHVANTLLFFALLRG